MKSEIHQPVPELPVKDVEKAQAFYRDELGFSIAWIYPDKSIGAVSKGETAIFLENKRRRSLILIGSLQTILMRYMKR